MRAVTAPDGAEHTVRIEWVGNVLRRAPRTLRRRVRRMADAADVADVGCAPDLGEALAVIVLVILAALVVVFVLPVAWGVLEVLVVLVVAAAVWATRVLFRRPWCIVQRDAAGDEVRRWRVVGWRQAHRVMIEAADSVAATGVASVEPPPAGWA